MSIKGLENMKEKYINNFVGKGISYADIYMFNFMQEVIDTFKDQSDQIADLRKQVAKTEIDYSDIKIGGTD